MKKFLFHILLFFAVIGAVDTFVGLAGDYLQRNAKGGKTGQFNNLVMKDNHDILVLGSSRALHHYDTPFLSDTLGMDVYNAGFKGNGVVLACGILELVLKHSHPKLIVFDIEPAFDIYTYEDDDNHKRYLYNLKPYYRIPEIGDIFKDISREDWLAVHSGMVRHNTSIITMTVDNLVASSKDSAGFEPLAGTLLSETKAVIDPDREIDTLKIRYVERLIGIARAKEIPVLFIASPKYGCTDSSELDPLKGICLENQVPFLDYYSSQEFNSHREWFQEATHLNATGARIFSSIICGDINSVLQI